MKDQNFKSVTLVQVPDETFNEMITEILAAKEEIVSMKEEIEQLRNFKTSPYFTTDEAMAYVRIKSRTTFAEKVDMGLISIHGYSSPGRALFVKEDLDLYIAENSTKAAA